MAIIIHDKDDKIEEMFLADDGHEGDISIPAILISKSDGNKILNYYLMNKDNKEEINKIRFEIKFDIENKNNTVNYDIWYTPDTENVYTFLKEFEKYQKSLGDSVKLGVHFVTFPHFGYDEENKEKDKSPKEDCLGSGLYCIRPGKLGITDGSIIVLESIKQKCIYNIANNQNKLDNFWKYMSIFHDNCILRENNFDQMCSNEAINKAQISLDSVNRCVYDSFEATSYEKENTEYQKISRNKILDKEFEMRKQFLISRVPSITINGRLYIGSWKPNYVFEAICAALIKKPEVCYVEGNFEREGVGFTFIGNVFIILIVIVINVSLFLICREFIRRKVMERISYTNIDSQINTAVNSYIALKEMK